MISIVLRVHDKPLNLILVYEIKRQKCRLFGIVFYQFNPNSFLTRLVRLCFKHCRKRMVLN